jgi:methylated-DNA-[protein]-cysteine S-methyltransferase
MLYSTSVKTTLGTFRIFCDNTGLTKIILPDTNYTTPKNEKEETRIIPPLLELAAKQIVEYCKGRRTTFDLPLSVSGTIFQQQVWDIIYCIPYGQTMSYGEIARQLGSTGKARAVGGAAHANALPLIIPCHRVIGSNGTLTGFAGGITLKKRLLHLEKNILNDG